MEQTKPTFEDAVQSIKDHVEVSRNGSVHLADFFAFANHASVKEINQTTPEGLTLAGVAISLGNGYTAELLLIIRSSDLIPTQADMDALKVPNWCDDYYVSSVKVSMGIAAHSAELIASLPPKSLEEEAREEAKPLKKGFNLMGKKNAKYKPSPDKIEVQLRRLNDMRAIMYERGDPVMMAKPTGAVLEAVPA